MARPHRDRGQWQQGGQHVDVGGRASHQGVELSVSGLDANELSGLPLQIGPHVIARARKRQHGAVYGFTLACYGHIDRMFFRWPKAKTVSGASSGEQQ